jgi:hypothetical protein
MPRKFLFLILILFGFTLLIYAETIPKAGGRAITNQFGPIPFNPKSTLSSDPIRGDANGDGQINAGDVVYLIMYLFRDGPPPPTLENGDANGDDVINIVDMVYLLNYLVMDGPPPPPQK